MTRFILDQLHEAGVDTIFALPGDFILPFCKHIEEDCRFKLLTMSHEPGVGFAACGAARGPGRIGVACITYGAGALNMVNPVAAAYAEKTPLLVLTGGPGQEERAHGILVHHQVKTFESQLRVFREVTHFQAVLDDPQTAAALVRHAIDVCRLYSLPVYLEVPRDMIDQPIAVGQAQRLQVPTQQGAVEEAAGEIIAKLATSSRPVLVVGVEVHRQGLGREVARLAEALALPVVTTFMGRGSFPDDHPRYAGTYLGPASSPGVRELVEESDLVLMVGALLSDTNMGLRLTSLDPRQVVAALSRKVDIGYHTFEDVPLPGLLAALQTLAEDLERPVGGEIPRRPRPCRAADEAGEHPIRVADMIAEINRSFAVSGEMPLVVDTGDCLFCSHEIDTQLVLASAYYATMGFAVPAAMGWEATGGDRPLVLVGDGGYQMTGWELIHAPRWGVHPIVLVMNNASWEMLESFLPSRSNALPRIAFAEMARTWGIYGRRVGTPRDLRLALAEARAQSGAALIEITLERRDISATLATFTRSVGTTALPSP